MAIENFDTWAATASGFKYLPYSLVAQAASVTAGVMANHFSWKTVKNAFLPENCGRFDQLLISQKIGVMAMTILQFSTQAASEEILFRGILQDGLLTKGPKMLLRFGGKSHLVDSTIAKIARTGVSAIVFSAYHLTNKFLGMEGEQINFQLANTLGLGLVSAVIKEKTGSIWPAFGIHGGYNAMVAPVPLISCALRSSNPTQAHHPESSETFSKEPENPLGNEICKPVSQCAFTHPVCPADKQKLIDEAKSLEGMAQWCEEVSAKYHTNAEMLRNQAQD